MAGSVRYGDINISDAQVDRLLTAKQQTLPKDLQKKIVKSKLKDNKRGRA
tara:strand:+ start:5417 stop:5566 length:150 start_codon:yes stop_codon:yes gene_type:complete